MWRGGRRYSLSVAAAFAWRCLNSRTISPFPHPPHRTGHADLPHPARGQELTPSPTKGPSAVHPIHRTGPCYSGTATGDTALLITPVISAFPAVASRSACATSFSRIAQRSLALRPAHSPSHLVTLYLRGFSHFVTSMTAPIASGWSNIAGWVSHPLGKRRLNTAHATTRHSRR
jgi:hypothetical protein